MDNQTKRRLKQQDQFLTVTDRGIQWAGRNRRTAAIAIAMIFGFILIVVGAYSFFEHRSQEAATAFGAAMQTYQTPLVQAAQPPPPGMKSFDTSDQRAKAANAQFTEVARRFGFTEDGKLAQYFAGLTYMEEGQNASAEDTLKKTAASWNSDLAALGNLALAQLYEQTGRNSQAAELYQKLSKGKAVTVPAGLAQLQLGELYSAEGDTAKARDVYARLKDSDKDKKGTPGAAGAIAAQKLNPKADPLPGQQP